MAAKASKLNVSAKSCTGIPLLFGFLLKQIYVISKQFNTISTFTTISIENVQARFSDQLHSYTKIIAKPTILNYIML